MTFLIYRSLDLELPTFSSRSYFYQLLPIGVDTPWVESLTGYIARLAEAHCVSTGVLLSRVIAPSLNKDYLNKGSKQGIRELFNRSHTLNPMGIMSLDLVNAFQKFTCNNNLSSLTLERYKNIFCPRNLLHKFKTWCPLCYQDNYQNNKPIYEPLLWTIDSIKVCPKHKVLLQNRCPHCHQQQLWLSWNSRAGYCSHCQKWVGSHIVSKDSTDDWNYLLGNSIIIRDFLGTSYQEILSIKSEDTYKSINALIQSTFQGNMTAFARTFNLPKNTVWMWCQGKAHPRLEELLRLAFTYDLSLLEFFKLSYTKKISLTINSKRFPQQSRQTRQSPQKFDLQHLEATLQHFIDNEIEPPLTMAEVARKVGYHRRTITRHFPELCKAIADKHQRYREIIRNQKIEKCCQEVKAVITQLLVEGVYPSEAQVAKRISQPGYLRYKIVREAFNEAREQTQSPSNPLS